MQTNACVAAVTGAMLLTGGMRGAAAQSVPKDFEGTIKMGVEYGATSIELWQDYRGFPLVPNEDLRRWAAMVERNTSP